MSKSLKNTLPVKICWEKACNYMKWRVAKTSKLKLLLAKAHTHTPLSQTLVIIFKSLTSSKCKLFPPFFLNPSSAAEWAKITDARKAEKWVRGPSSPVPRQSEPLPKHAWKPGRRQRHKDPIFFFFFRENRFHVGGEQHNWHVCNVRSRAGRGVWRKSEVMLACGVSSINAV